jgi:hypothetical protein
MTKFRLEWTDLPKKNLGSADVACFIDGKWRLSRNHISQTPLNPLTVKPVMVKELNHFSHHAS